MRRATVSEDTIAIEKSQTEEAGTTVNNQIRESLDCPNCYDTMLKSYDWDKMKYICENCGLTIVNPLLLPSTFIVEDRESK